MRSCESHVIVRSVCGKVRCSNGPCSSVSLLREGLQYDHSERGPWSGDHLEGRAINNDQTDIGRLLTILLKCLEIHS